MTCHKKGKVYYASTRRGKRRWSEVGGGWQAPPVISKGDPMGGGCSIVRAKERGPVGVKQDEG